MPVIVEKRPLPREDISISEVVTGAAKAASDLDRATDKLEKSYDAARERATRRHAARK